MTASAAATPIRRRGVPARPAISNSSSTIRTMRGRTLRQPHQIVDRNRRRAQQATIRARSSGAGSASSRASISASSGSRAGSVAAHDRLQHGNNVGRFGNRRRALVDQAVGALGARIERRARHGEDLAALFERQARGDQRAGALRRLDDDDAERQPGDEPVAAGKVARRAAPSRAAFRRRARPPADRVEQRRMLGRIDVVVAAGEHRDGAGREACAMRRGVDAARQPGDDGKAGLAELARDPLGEFRARAPRRCASRRSPTIGIASTPRLPRTRDAAAARRRSFAAAADNRLRRSRQRRRRACAPPRFRARLGSREKICGADRRRRGAPVRQRVERGAAPRRND